MDKHPVTFDREAALRAIEATQELGLLSPEPARATRELIAEAPSLVHLESKVLRKSGLLASQLRALTRIVGHEETSRRSEAAEEEPQADLAHATSGPQGQEGPSRSRSPKPVVHPLWIGFVAALLFFGTWIPLLRAKAPKAEATPQGAPVQRERFGTVDEDLERARADTSAAPRQAARPRPILLPTDEEVIEAFVENAACQAPDGALASWTVDPTGPLQLTVFSDGKLLVLDEDDAPQQAPLRVPGGECKVRRVVRTPWGRGVLLLVEDLGVDCSSRIFLFDAYDRRFDLVFDSSDRTLLQDALRRNGKERYADNDVTEVFFTSDGEIAFTTEDNDMLVTHLEEGRVVRLDAVHRVRPFRDTSVAPRSVPNGEAFFTVLYK